MLKKFPEVKKTLRVDIIPKKLSSATIILDFEVSRVFECQMTSFGMQKMCETSKSRKIVAEDNFLGIMSGLVNPFYSNKINHHM